MYLLDACLAISLHESQTQLNVFHPLPWFSNNIPSWIPITVAFSNQIISVLFDIKANNRPTAAVFTKSLKGNYIYLVRKHFYHLFVCLMIPKLFVCSSQGIEFDEEMIYDQCLFSFIWIIICLESFSNLDRR